MLDSIYFGPVASTAYAAYPFQWVRALVATPA